MLLLVLGLSAVAAAQNIQNPQSAVDNLMVSSLHVDPTTGALQLQIPLGGPPGRGEANLPVVLRYSSKVWNIKYMSTLQCGGEPVSSYRAEYAKSSASGWTSSVGWFLPQQDLSLETYDFLTQKPATQGNLVRIARKYVTLPDGSRHEMRRDDGLHSFGDDFSGNYYSVDGSRLWLDAAGTLFMPDGSRIQTVNGQTRYIDRNGNYLVYDATAGVWHDTLDRSIGIPVPGAAPAVGDTQYTLPGGMTYTLRWRNLGDVLTDPNQVLHYKGDALTANCSLGGGQGNNLFSTMDDQQKVLQQGIHNPVVLYQIVLPHDASNPNPPSYTFTYNVYGELDKIVYPTGGSEQLTYGVWAPLGGQLDDGTYSQANRGVGSRTVNDGVASRTWSYFGNVFDPGVDPLTAPRIVTAPDNTTTTTWYYKSRGTEIKYGFDDARAGMAREERTYSSAGTMLRRTVYQLAQDGPQAGGYSTAKRNARVVKKVEIILDTGGNALARATEMSYDSDLNVTSKRSYDYVSISQATGQTGDIPAIPNGALLRTDETDYLTSDPNYRNQNLLSLATATRVKDGAGNIVAQSSVNYDEAAYPLLTYGAVTGWSDPGTTARGNPTTSSHWLNFNGTTLSTFPAGTYLATHVQYDQSGNVRNTWDAKGVQSQIEYSSNYLYAYPTLARTAVPDPSGSYGSTSALVSTTIYDFNTGLVTSTTDPNNKTTSFSYVDPQTSVVDPLRRVRTITRPDGGVTTHNYNDTPGSLSVQTLTKQDATRSIDTTETFDALGRPSRSFLNVGGGTYNTADTKYDSMGRVSQVSNPYLSSGPGSAPNPSALWTTNVYDALGRVKSVTTADSAQVITDYGASTSNTLGTSVTVTDQTGKVRRSLTDALGRLVRVDEPDSNGNLGSVTSPNQATSYAYDVRGNLRLVTQGSQQRFFSYDSLSRLLRARNPEMAVNTSLPALTDSITSNNQWSMGYTYDNNGNLTTRSDARNVTSTLAYDTLNRNTTITYTNDPVNTPAVSRFYDGFRGGVDNQIANGQGRQWQTETGGSSGSRLTTTSYDALGKPLAQNHQFYSNSAWSGAYTSQRGYDLAGHVVSQAYPSGHAVTYNYDQAGRLGDKDAQNVAFSGNLGDGIQKNYSTEIVYSTLGGITKEKYGTDVPVYNKSFYNSRGQLSEIRVSTSYTGPDDTNWNRGAIINHYSDGCWGRCGGENSTTSMTDNNGNLRKQEVYVPHDDQISNYTTWWQGYDYDSLNRLQRVHENAGGALDSQQDYVYDRHGNRTIDQTNTWGTGINKKLFTVNLNNDNRLGVPAGGRGLISYDNAGNLTTDTYSTAALTRAYDAESRMASETQTGSNVVGVYTYNADGQRVRRKVNGVETWQVYGIGGELAAEYAANGGASSPQKEYGYRNGQMLIAAEVQTGSSSSQNVTWTNVSSTITVTGNTIQKTGGVNDWDAGAVSTQTIASGNGSVEFTPGETQTWRMCGLGNADTGASYGDIEYAIFIDGGGGLSIYESGTNRGSFGAYAASDRLKVAVENGAVKYYRNSTLLYTSTVVPQFPLLVDTSLNTNSAGVYNVVITSAPSTGGSSWLIADQLGTPRMILDKTGSLANVKRHDYLPFGEELTATQGLRTSALGYAAPDSVRQKFASKERDNETGLDYFLARYYSATQGRFTSPDPIIISDNQKGNPQLWNLYNYVGNNPLGFTDPTGMELVKLGQHSDSEIEKRLKQIEGAMKAVDNDKSLSKEDRQDLKEALSGEKQTLSLEKQGNAAVGNYLASLDSVGERQGLKVSDFTLSTDSAHDFSAVKGITGDPGDNATMFTFGGGYSSQIFINTQSLTYQQSLGNGTRTDGQGNTISVADINKYMGTAAIHERSHRDSPTVALQDSEGRAYTEQLRVLQKFGPNGFQSKEFFYQAAAHAMNGSERP